VLAVDRPGHGLADAFDYQGVDILAHARRFLGDILDSEGLPAVPIVACSMGGLWSVAFALSHPDRVPQLLLVGAPAGIQRSVPLLMRLGTLPILNPLLSPWENSTNLRRFSPRKIKVSPHFDKRGLRLLCVLRCRNQHAIALAPSGRS
jgi:pimeloyl-ACP methyl ester carboxylesterase